MLLPCIAGLLFQPACHHCACEVQGKQAYINSRLKRVYYRLSLHADSTGADREAGRTVYALLQKVKQYVDRKGNDSAVVMSPVGSGSEIDFSVPGEQGAYVLPARAFTDATGKAGTVLHRKDAGGGLHKWVIRAGYKERYTGFYTIIF